MANLQVAIAATLCTAFYPVFFAQSSLAQVDLAAAGLTFWALLAYVEDRRIAMLVWFSLAALAKETAILLPAALLLYECIVGLSPAVAKWARPAGAYQFNLRKTAGLLLPTLPLALWYAYHHLRTGYTFGNPEYFRYNVQATLHPLRIVLAFLMRLWQLVGYMNLYPLTLAALFAMWMPPLLDQASRKQGSGENEERPRIALGVQFAFLAIIATYALAMAVLGGAVLARYMLPVVPLVILICVSTIWRRVCVWRAAVVLVLLAFGAGWFINPPYGFSLEDNHAYADYIALHRDAETFVEAQYPMARVLTAWPASGELSQPSLGYITRPMRVLQIEDFTLEELLSANEVRSSFDVALVFSTKYEPPHSLLENWVAWQRIKAEYFGYHRDVPPAAAARILGGTLVYGETRKGQWVGVIEMKRDQVQEALSF